MNNFGMKQETKMKRQPNAIKTNQGRSTGPEIITCYGLREIG